MGPQIAWNGMVDVDASDLQGTSLHPGKQLMLCVQNEVSSSQWQNMRSEMYHHENGAETKLGKRNG